MRPTFGVLLPVKEFAQSKHRLAEWLCPEDRALLARTMFEDVWATLRAAMKAGAADNLLVVTSEPTVIARCRNEGVACMEEDQQRSHSESVQTATRWAMTRGISSLLSVPIDTPAVAMEEIVELARLAQHYSVVIVPSADGTGTNALLRTPPETIEPQFGPGSCRRHAVQAQTKLVSYLVRPVAGLAADIDTADDVERFLAFVSSAGRACGTATLLHQFLEARRGAVVCS